MTNEKRIISRIRIESSIPTVSQTKLGDMIYCLSDGKIYIRKVDSLVTITSA